jgi:hypothetical protein
MRRILAYSIISSAAIISLPSLAAASFHVMQVEQIIGGVNGDPTAQAIQLRMRGPGQNQMQFGRLVAHNASGGGDVILATFPGPVANSATGSRVLIASAAFAQYTSPAASADRIMSNLIPASYLAAGSLTFEDSGGSTIYWRVSWGGVGYTGSNLGSTTNDADGNFGPPFSGPLPSTSLKALKFGGNAAAASTTNTADYALTGGAAGFNNNAGTGYNVVTPSCTTCTGDVNGDLHVDGADIQKIASAYANNTAGTLGSVCADADHNGTIDDTEISAIVDIMLGNTAPSPPCN